MTEPAFWRVTLAWPKPREWDELARGGPSFARWLFKDPDRLRQKFAIQIQAAGGDVESLDLRPRTVRLVARMPAHKSQGYDYRSYQSSAEHAIGVVVRSAEFAARCISGSERMLEPLPEPVRIKAEPMAAEQLR